MEGLTQPPPAAPHSAGDQAQTNMNMNMNAHIYVHVRVGRCDIAIPVDQVRQALPLPPQGLTALPRHSGGLLGLAEFAGAAVPIVALERWVPLDAPQGDGVDTLPRLLVMQHASGLVGMRVDAVLGVKALAAGDIRKILHQPDDNELFESVVPASDSAPVLCILEVARLMRLSQAWCEQAQVDLAVPSAPDAPAARGAQQEVSRTQGCTSQRYAVLRIGVERWAVPVNAVERVVPVPAAELALGPRDRSWAICQWQGRKLPLVDISEGRQASDRQAAPWMVVLSHGPLLLGLTLSECQQFVDVPQQAMAHLPGDSVSAGVTLLPDGSRLQVLDVAKLFEVTPEASVSRWASASPGAPGAPGNAAPVDATEPSPYLVFDADQRYASPVQGVLGVVELSVACREDLRSGRPGLLPWRGQTLRLVSLPAIAKSVAHADPLLAVVVQAPEGMMAPIGIAIRSLTDWLPAHSARRTGIRMGAMGELGLINAKGAVDHANLVLVDLSEMAYLLG